MAQSSPIARKVQYSVACVAGSEDTIHDAAVRVERELQRMRRFGQHPEVVYAYAACETCYGQGTVSAKSHKLYAEKTCPTCKGRDSQIDCLSDLQKIRMSAAFADDRQRISAELDADDEDSRRFNAAYRYAEELGESDPHRWACENKNLYLQFRTTATA